MTKFSDLKLDPKVLKAVAEAGYEIPTPIQAQAIPDALEGRDILGIAQTGTGKTASFVLPLVTRLSRGRARARMPRSLVLAPTRELAAQVAENFDTYAKYTRLTKALLIGGVSFSEQDKLIDRGVDVLIATPGRLLDHFERGKLLLTGVEVMVVDEADRMLDMGFIPDIERIFQLTPFTRQTMFYSATMAPEIERITNTFLSNPKRVEVARQATTAETIEQQLIELTPTRRDRAFAEKRAMLRALIESEGEACSNAIIFCNRKIDVDVVAKSLIKHGLQAAPIHGDLDQSVRTRTLDGFRDGSLRLLIASDVAARGLDVPAVSHVFNFDVPSHAEDYVHRIGRTGRAGRSGKAFTIATPADEKYLAAIEALLQRKLPRGVLPEGFTAQADDGLGAGERAERSETKRGEKTERPRRERRPRAEKSGERMSDKAMDAVSSVVETVTEAVSAAVAPVAELVGVTQAREESRPVREESPREETRAPREETRAPREDNRPARETRDDSRPAREPRDDSRSRDDRNGDRNNRGRRDRHRDDQQVVGMGDHVPDFLMREFRTSAG